MTIHVCEACGTEFQAYKSRRRRYCSHKCYAASHRGSANGRYGGGLFQSGGRAFIVCRDGTLLLYYRGLVEAHLRRELTPSEVVHHINGDSTDDRIENLQVLTQSEHINLHRQDMLAARAARKKIAKAAA